MIGCRLGWYLHLRSVAHADLTSNETNAGDDGFDAATDMEAGRSGDWSVDALIDGVGDRAERFASWPAIDCIERAGPDRAVSHRPS